MSPELPQVGREDRAAQHADQRLIPAYRAALSVASELDPAFILQRIVDLSREVVPVRYAALGVADERGRLTKFLTSGMADEEVERIGTPPAGKGLLGTMIAEREPLMVDAISDDPRSVGFPPEHPPMHRLLGTPILLGDRVLGNLYLSDRLDGTPFTTLDLESLQVLAAHAAAAIDRALLYQELRTARAMAEEQRDNLRVILDNLPAGVIIHSGPDGEVQLANAAATSLLLGPGRVSGMIPRQGRDFRVLSDDGEPLPSHATPDQVALAGGVIRNRMVAIERADGSICPVLVQASPLQDSGGAVRRAVVVFQDVTQLRQAQQVKDDFLSLVSHEFRTPLTAVHGGAMLLATQGETIEPEVQRELLADIANESERLNQMLENMLSLTAIQAGSIEVATEPVLIGPLARHVAEDVQRRTDRHDVIVEVERDVPPAEAHPDLLDQVLRNLCENAVKYSPLGGPIRITAHGRGNRVEITVSDSGNGIAPEVVDEIFMRFRRPGADPSIRGMGLGLYLSRLLVEAQGGTITAESPGLGQGATFRVDLPVAAAWNNGMAQEGEG